MDSRALRMFSRQRRHGDFREWNCKPNNLYRWRDSTNRHLKLICWSGINHYYRNALIWRCPSIACYCRNFCRKLHRKWPARSRQLIYPSKLYGASKYHHEQHEHQSIFRNRELNKPLLHHSKRWQPHIIWSRHCVNIRRWRSGHVYRKFTELPLFSRTILLCNPFRIRLFFVTR